MLIRAKIENQTKVNQKYYQIYSSIYNNDTKRNIFKVTLKQLSCNLCYRFLNEPVIHSPCKFVFCKLCLKEWVKYFGFCKSCKLEISSEEVELLPIQHQLWDVIKIIDIDCRFGQCSKNFSEIKLKEEEKWKKMLENDLAPIEENSKDFETLDYSFHVDLKEKSYFKMMQEDDSTIISSRKNNKMNLSLAFANASHSNGVGEENEDRLNESFSNLMRNSLNKTKKRNFKVTEYDYHIIKKHHWPALNIRYSESKIQNHELIDKQVKTISYAGFKNDKKTGPGVVYIIKQNKVIETYMGPFMDDLSNDHGTILRDNKLIYEGEIKKGKKQGFGTERWYFEIPDKELDFEVNQKDKFCYLEYKGEYKKGIKEGNGELYFFGNYSLFRKYFKHLKTKNYLENNNIDFFNTINTPNQDINTIIKKEIDPNFNFEELFKLSSSLDFSNENNISNIYIVNKKSLNKKFSLSKFI